ncbi:transposase [Nocardia abscessus]|uniref:transposase n=1 Tax=Nocardia abscessus TaxID=120957 RepID=UPI00313CE780
MAVAECMHRHSGRTISCGRVLSDLPCGLPTAEAWLPCGLSKQTSRVVTLEKYPDELKARAVRLYQDSDPKPTVRKLAQQLSVYHEALRNWIRQADAGRRPEPADVDLAEENERLRKQVAELERANDILRSVSAYFASELDQTPR